MWFAALDGLVVGLLVALVALRPFGRDGIGSVVDTLGLGLTGGLVGSLLGFALVAGSESSGPLQVTAIISGVVGAGVTLAVLRGWVVGDRAAARAAVAAAERDARTRSAERRRAERRARREPSKLAELAVLVLAARRRR